MLIALNVRMMNAISYHCLTFYNIYSVISCKIWRVARAVDHMRTLMTPVILGLPDLCISQNM
jgi:hypothetical protein